MNCPKCQLLEMRVNRVENGKIYYVCKKCGKEEVKTFEELEKQDE